MAAGDPRTAALHYAKVSGVWVGGWNQGCVGGGWEGGGGLVQTAELCTALEAIPT